MKTAAEIAGEADRLAKFATRHGVFDDAEIIDQLCDALEGLQIDDPPEGVAPPLPLHRRRKRLSRWAHALALTTAEVGR